MSNPNPLAGHIAKATASVTVEIPAEFLGWFEEQASAEQVKLFIEEALEAAMIEGLQEFLSCNGAAAKGKNGPAALRWVEGVETACFKEQAIAVEVQSHRIVSVPNILLTKE